MVFRDRKSVYIWNSPRTQSGRRALAERLLAIGVERIWLKAGGDGGYAWIPGEVDRIPWHPAPQWDDEYIKDFAGLDVRPWFYIEPNLSPELDAIERALDRRFSDAIALNPETEWRVQSPDNSFRSLDQANAFVRAAVVDLREALHTRYGTDVTVGFSSVPSWSDFPYEGFDEACDFSHPQTYWKDNEMPPDGEAGAEAGEDQVEAHLRRVGKAKPCTPILPTSRQMSDLDVVRQAQNALGDYPDLAGFSAWEAGNGAFQADAFGRCLALLPAEAVVNSPFIEIWERIWDFALLREER